MQVAYGLGTELIYAWTFALTQPSSPIITPITPSPLSASIITECSRTSIQIFSQKFLCTNLPKAKLEILWNSSTIFRSSHQRCSIKKLFLKILQYSQKNTCVRVSFPLVWSLEEVCKWKWNFISRSLLLSKNYDQHPTKHWLVWEGI